MLLGDFWVLLMLQSTDEGFPWSQAQFLGMTVKCNAVEGMGKKSEMKHKDIFIGYKHKALQTPNTVSEGDVGLQTTSNFREEVDCYFTYFTFI